MSAAEIVIVGAGPAGATAAIRLAEAGIASTLLDDNAKPGGQVYRAGTADYRDTVLGHDPRGDGLRAALARHGDRIDYRPCHDVVAIEPGPFLSAVGRDGQSAAFAPHHVVLAPGAVEISVPVPGWTLPGVYTLGGLQILLKSAGVVPVGRVVLGGAGPFLYLVAAQLAAAGVEIAAIIDAAPRPTPLQFARMARAPLLLARGLRYAALLRRRGVPLLSGHAVIGVRGQGRPREVAIAPLDPDWLPLPGDERSIPCDVVGLGFGFRDNTELTQLAGCAHDYEPATGGWRVRRAPDLQTSVAGVFAAGGSVPGDADWAVAEGEIVAASIARRLGIAHPALHTAEAAARRRLKSLSGFRAGVLSWSGLRPGIFDAAMGETVLCRCRDVTRQMLGAAFDRGLRDPRAIMEATGAGRGLCQGRVCAPALNHLIAGATRAKIEDMPMPEARAPLRPIAARDDGAADPGRS